MNKSIKIWAVWNNGSWDQGQLVHAPNFIRWPIKAFQLSISYVIQVFVATLNTLEYVRHNCSYCFKSSVRMIRKTRRLPHSELIQHQERVKVSQLETKYKVVFQQLQWWDFFCKKKVPSGSKSTVRCWPPFYRYSCGHERRLPPPVPHWEPSFPPSSQSLCWYGFTGHCRNMKYVSVFIKEWDNDSRS